MGRSSTGIFTTPDVLGWHLEELDLSRKELASRLQVSVRTIHNIEHGRKRVDPQMLGQLAHALNTLWHQKYPRAQPLALTSDHFIADPMAAANVFFQGIAMNRPELVYGEVGVGHSSCHFRGPARSFGISFAGDFLGQELPHILENLHRTFEVTGMSDARTYVDRKNMAVAIATSLQVKHPVTDAPWEFRAVAELDLRDNKIYCVTSTYDAELVAEFIRSGVAPEKKLP